MQVITPVPQFSFHLLAVGALLLLPLCASAQQGQDVAPLGPPLNAPALGIRGVPTPGVQRIVDECDVGAGAGLCATLGSDAAGMPEFEARIARLQIPGFQPGDELHHVYVLSHVQNNGSGGGSAFPDEFGLLTKEDRFVSSSAGAEDEPQYYFTSVNVDTLDTRVTLDLYQVKLRSFLVSLQNALYMGKRSALRDSMQPGRRPLPMAGSGAAFMEQRLTIHGEQLTVDEVLDAIYLDTGCIVNLEGDTLTLESCR